MKQLSETWFAEGYIDFELKKYTLLAYLQEVDKYFNENKLYPQLADIIFHYNNLVAFRDACWYSWTALADSLEKLARYRFEWLLPGHGWPVSLPAAEMNARLRALVARMRKGNVV